MSRLPILLASLVLLAMCSFAQEQSKSDLEVKVQTTGAVRGGESFSYTIIAKNIGPDAARKAHVNNDRMTVGEIVSGISAKGNCELTGRRGQETLRCELGDIGPGESVNILVTAKIYDFGDSSDQNNRSGMLGFSAKFQEFGKSAVTGSGAEKLGGGTNEAFPTEPLGEPISSVYLGAEEVEENEENNNARVEVALLPSRNIPPRIKILSPKEGSILTRRAKAPFQLKIEVEAFDPDGSVDKVVVRHHGWLAATPLMEDGKYLFLYEGKKYTPEELDDHWSKFPPPEPLATQTGKNTFTYIFTDPPYGPNSFSIQAEDDGGRRNFASVSFLVKGDATIEFVSPQLNQIIEPGSDIIVETASVMNEGIPKEIVLEAWDFIKDPGAAKPRLKLVSKQGNTYRHRYVLKNVQGNDGYSGLRAKLTEDSGATSETSVGFFVRKRPKIVFTSVSNGQVFVRPKEIVFEFDNQNGHSDDRFKVYVDGKYQTELWGRGYVWRHPEPGVHTVEIVTTFKDVELARSEPIRIIVK